MYTILEKIRPEVIFEEQPASKFDDYHVFNNSMSLESTAINVYGDKYGVDIVLVDAETEAETIIEKYGKVHK